MLVTTKSLESAQVLALIGDGKEMGSGTILTAPNDPRRLTVWHTLDTAGSRASLQFEAYNQLDTALQGVAIRSVPNPGYLPGGELQRRGLLAVAAHKGNHAAYGLGSFPCITFVDTSKIFCHQVSAIFPALWAQFTPPHKSRAKQGPLSALPVQSSIYSWALHLRTSI